MKTQIKIPVVALSLFWLINARLSTAFGQSGVWTNADSLPQAVFGLCTVAGTNGLLYAAGGAISACGRTNGFFAYNPATNGWTAEASLPAAITGFALANLNGTLYTIGGESGCGIYANAQKVTAYNIASNSWTSMNPFPFAIYSENTAVANGTLYVLGGYDQSTGGTWTNSVFAYNPTNDSWSLVSFMPALRYWPAVAVADNIIYVMGGAAENGLTNTVWSFNPATGIWATNASMPIPFENAGADTLNGMIYVTGGAYTNSYSSVVEAYDPQSDTWTTMPPLPAGTVASGVTAFDGKLYVVGGSQNSDSIILSTVQVFTPTNVVTGPVGLWHLDEDSGTTTADSAGSHPGTLFNSPTWVTGVHSNALEFDGSSQYVLLNSGPILGASSNLTIEAWIEPNNNSSASYGFWDVYDEGGNGTTAIELGLQNNFNGTYSPYFGVNGSVTAPGMAVNQWHHLAAVLQSGVGGTLYVDGQAVATSPTMTATTDTATETDLARSTMDARYFGGVIDEVRVFNTARTAAQVLSDFQQYTPPPPPPATADLAIGETVSPNPVMMYSNVTYTTSVTNFGPDTADSVIVTNTWNQLYLVSATSSQGTCSFANHILVCNLGSLASNGIATVSFTATGEMPISNLLNTCSVTSSATDPNLTNNTDSTLLTILAPPPDIVTQPTNQTISANGTVTLSVTASSYLPLTYQWQFNGTNIDGATNSTLILNGTTLAEAGSYSVLVSNAQGTVNSAVAVLSVINIQVYAGITISGPVGTNYEVDYANDLSNPNWITLTNLMLPDDPYLFIDTTSPGNPHRFYRVLQK